MSGSLTDPWPKHHFLPITPRHNCGQEVTHSAVQFTANLPLALTVHTCFILQILHISAWNYPLIIRFSFSLYATSSPHEIKMYHYLFCMSDEIL